MSTHIISDELKLTRVLKSALRAFKRTILPLDAFATAWDDVPLGGNDKMSVPFYPLHTGKSKRRKPKQKYSSKTHDTATESREVIINRNMVQAISLTAEQQSRQPMLDPDMHGTLMGEQLAIDVIADLFRSVSAGVFQGESIPPTAKANFDEDDVANLGEICDEEHWPSAGRSLIMRPGFGYNLAKQPALLDQSQSGSGEVLRQAQLPPIMGFDTFRTAGLPSNNDTILDFTADAGTDKLTVSGFEDPADEVLSDYFAAGDAVEVKTDDTLPAGLVAATRYYVVNVDDENSTLQLSATQGETGDPIDLTSAGTGNHEIQRKENIGAIVTARQSALLVGFAPIKVTPAIRKELFAHQIVKEKASKIVIEYRHFADPDTNEEFQVIEAHYGIGIGDRAALKRVEQIAA